MLNEGEKPGIYCLGKFRSVFTIKKLLETVSKQQGTDDQQPTGPKRTSIRQSPITSTTYECVCIFCVSILRKQEIGNLWYNEGICVPITQSENQPWKRRTVGFSQLRHVKSYQLKLVTTGRATNAILGLRQATMGLPMAVVNRLEMSILISGESLIARRFSIASDRCPWKRENNQTAWNDKTTCILFNVFRCWRHLVFIKKHIRWMAAAIHDMITHDWVSLIEARWRHGGWFRKFTVPFRPIRKRSWI